MIRWTIEPQDWCMFTDRFSDVLLMKGYLAGPGYIRFDTTKWVSTRCTRYQPYMTYLEWEDESYAEPPIGEEV